MRDVSGSASHIEARGVVSPLCALSFRFFLPPRVRMLLALAGHQRQRDSIQDEWDVDLETQQVARSVVDREREDISC